jgi:hypothetical protein
MKQFIKPGDNVTCIGLTPEIRQHPLNFVEPGKTYVAETGYISGQLDFGIKNPDQNAEHKLLFYPLRWFAPA